MQQRAFDVARSWAAGAASRYAFAAGAEPREELRGELVEVVEERVDGCAANDEPGADPQRERRTQPMRSLRSVGAESPRPSRSGTRTARWRSAGWRQGSAPRGARSRRDHSLG